MSNNFSEEFDYSSVLKFRKRKGTTDLGKLYEEYFPAYIILKLLQDKEVRDFRLSANDDQFGAFDDLVLEVEYTNKSIEKYAIQLKHKEKSNATIKNFNEDKPFIVFNFYRSFQQNKNQLSGYKIILFTNAKFPERNNEEDNLEKDKESVKVRITECVPSSVINAPGSGKSYQFHLATENSEKVKQKYNDFFKQFILYTNQVHVQKLKQEYIAQFLEKITSQSSVSDKYLKFISEWSITDEMKWKLTKNIMIKVITLYILEGLIQPHKFCEVNGKKKILQEAISNFNVTVFRNKSLEKVVELWGDAKRILQDYDIKIINEILQQFQICEKYIEHMDNLSDEEYTKLLWVMDKCPLILKDHPSLYEAVKLCGEKSKFVFVTDNLDDEKIKQLTVFKTFADLKRHSSTCNDRVKNITFTLFEENTSIGNLIKENDAFLNLLTTDELVQITDNTNLLRLNEEKLCFPYVERHLYKNIIEFKYLQTLDEKTLVLISNMGNEQKLRDCLQNFEIVSIMDKLHEDSDDPKSRKKLQNYRNTSKNKENFDSRYSISSKKYKLYLNQTETSPEEFKKLCDEQTKYCKFHHLRYRDEYFEWVESIGDVSGLQTFLIRRDSCVDDEEKYGKNITSKLNIVVGDPGMGKSLFIKKLKNNLLSKYLTVMILPKDVPKLCQFLTHSKNVHTFFAFILKTKFSKTENFERQVLKLLLKNRKAIFLWDGLDELKEQNRILIEELILKLRENSVAQFLTSRGFLRKQLEVKFNVLCQELQPFVDKEQTNYIQERLKDISSNEELEAIIPSIKKNIADTSYRDILGVPLQIYMLTELFLQDFPKYKKLLGEFFVITDLYFHFIEEKCNNYFIVKKQFPSNYKEIPFMKHGLSSQMKNYQKVALESIFGTTFSLEGRTNSDFLNKIKDDGDEFGLITAVDVNLQPEFLHNSYAEYFAATYLAENCGNISNMAIIFERKYTNVKYFFDLLLAKNSPVHIAVLGKNLKYLQDYNGKDKLKLKDLQGRNALHLAASWGERYPLLEMSEISDDSKLKLKIVSDSIFSSTILIKDNINYEKKKESKEYYQIMHVLLENCDPNETDDLFNFTPLMYAEKSECLFAAAIIGKMESKNYLKTKDDSFINSLLYYAIKYEFIDIVNLFDDLKFIINNNGNSMLHTAAAINQLEYLRKLLNQNVYRQNINYQNLHGVTALMTAAENGHLETVKYLKQQNAKIDAANKNGFTPLMIAAYNGHLETVKYLIQENANVNAAANQEETPLYLTAFNGHLETVKYLIQQNANVDAANKNGFTPLMVAARNGHLETVKYLTQQNANVNAVDNEGQTSLHLAAQNGHLDTVKYLIHKSANVNATANKRKIPPLYLATSSTGSFKKQIDKSRFNRRGVVSHH